MADVEITDPKLLDRLNGGSSAPKSTGRTGLGPIDMIPWQKVDDVVRGVANGATFGMADKVENFMHSLAGGKDTLDERMTGKSYSDRRTDEAKSRTPVGYLAGDIAGSVVPAMAMSGGVGAAVPALRGMRVTSVAGNQALTGAGMSAADSAAHGEMPDWRKMALSGAGGGILGAAMGGASRLLPGPRARAAGNAFTDEDKSAATDFAQRAAGLGVPVNTPEAMTAVAPQRASRINEVYDTGTRLQEGASKANEFNAERSPLIEQTGKRLSGMLDQSMSPYETSVAAGKGIQDVKDLVRNSAEPYIQKSQSTFVPGLDKESPVIQQSLRSIKKNPASKEDIGNSPDHSIRAMDHLAVDLSARSTKAQGAGNPKTARIYSDKADELIDAMRSKSPAYATGQDILDQGRETAVRSAETGPLGRIRDNKTDMTPQSNAMFDVGTPNEGRASIDALKRMPPKVGENLLAHRIGDAAARDPRGFAGRVLPTDHSVDVARQAAGDKFPDISATLDALRAVNPTERTPVLESHVGLYHDMTRALQRLSAAGTVSRLNDPAFIPELGRMGTGQKAAHAATTATLADLIERLKIGNR